MSIRRLLARTLMLPTALICVTSAAAQEKIDMSGIRMLEQYEIEKAQSGRSEAAVPDVTVLMKLAPGAETDSIEMLGGLVESRIGSILIVRMPIDRVREMARLKAVKRISLGGKSRPLMDKARPASQVTQLQSTEGVGTAYSGKGVVTGFIDQGLDPNHINFMSRRNQSENRIKRIWHFTGEDATLTTYDTPSAIAGFVTDDSKMTHATHVAGIMSGAYNGDAGKVALLAKMPVTGNDIPSVSVRANPFYGVATDAEMALAVGEFYDPNVLKAAQLVRDYAREQGKPAVFNMSLGSIWGPHDGTDLVCQALAELGKDMVICVAAGNEGDQPVSLQQDFTAGNLTVSTFLAERGWSDPIGGGVDVWSATSEPFELTFVIYNLANNTIAYSYKMPAVPEGKRVSIVSSNYSGSGYERNAEFDKAFDGNVVVAAALDDENNRYEAMVYIDAERASGNTGNLVPGVILTGKAGQHVDMYAENGVLLLSNNVSGWTKGNGTQSISNMTCADNVISVGSYQSRDKWAVLGGGYSYYPSSAYETGNISPFSSYGTTLSGKVLPDLCAPGGAILSSYSTPYVVKETIDQATLSAEATVNDRDNYWGVMQGTSMATPYMSGTAALWLEADPSLTAADIKEIIEATSSRTGLTAVDLERAGAGKLDALEGMKRVLQMPSGIGAVFGDNDERMVLTTLQDAFGIFVAGDTSLKATIYNMTGLAVAKAAAAGESVTVSTAGLPRGIYMLTVVGSTGRYDRRVAVR